MRIDWLAGMISSGLAILAFLLGAMDGQLGALTSLILVLCGLFLGDFLGGLVWRVVERRRRMGP